MKMATSEGGTGNSDGCRHLPASRCRVTKRPLQRILSTLLVLTAMAVLCIDVCDGTNSTIGSSTLPGSRDATTDDDIYYVIGNNTNNSVSWNTCELDTTVYPDPIFGSVNGYDVGGSRGVCFRSTYNDSQLDGRNNSNNLILMNKILVEDKMSTDLIQYHSCLNGTNVVVVPAPYTRDPSWQGPTYATGQNISFSLFVETDLTQYIDPFQVEKPPYVQVWFRIFKCLAWSVGYCQPFLDSDRWSSYDNDGPGIVVYEDDLLLASYPTERSNNLTYTTQWVAGTLERISGSACKYYGSFNLTASLSGSMNRGYYFFIAHTTLQFHSLNGTTTTASIDNDNKTTMRVDIATGIGGGVLEVSDLPSITFISTPTKIYVGALIAVCGIVTFAQLVMIVKHRNHQVMVLAQAGLLGGLCGAALVAIVFSFIILPINDVFCQIDTLILIPATTAPAILVGRLWRVYSTLMGAARIGRRTSTPATISDRREDYVMKILGLLALSSIPSNCGSGHNANAARTRASSVGFRRTIPRRVVVQLVCILMLPQTILQICKSIVRDSYVYIDLSSDGTAGVQTCYSPGYRWDLYAGIALMAFMYLLAFYLAWCTRKLPSFFNEKDQIFRAALVNGIVTLFLVVMTAFFDVTDADPNITAVSYITLIVVISMTTNAAVVVPKIKRVLSGEKVRYYNMFEGLAKRY